MGVRTRVIIHHEDGSAETVVGPFNDRLLAATLALRYREMPVKVRLSVPEAEQLAMEMHDTLLERASAGCESDDIDAISWVNSLWALSSVIVALSRVSADGRYTSATITVA